MSKSEMKRPSPIPEDRTSAVPSLSVRGAAEAIAFYQRAFGAVETMRFDQPDGRVGHAELRIGQAHVTLADEFPELGFVSPKALGGTTISVHIYVEDVDGLAERALAAGAKLLRPIADEFYGDRVALLEDPFGHRWHFSSRVEEVSLEEMQRRLAALPSS